MNIVKKNQLRVGRIIPRFHKGYWETEKYSSLNEALAVVVMLVVVVMAGESFR